MSQEAPQAGEAPAQSRWKKEAKSWAILIAAVVIIRSSVFGIYEVPTGSMLPTIQLGDRVYGNKLAFGLNLPFGDRHLFTWSTPHRGDIVIFPSPRDGTTLIKRVVGIGGDTLSFRLGRLMINGKAVEETVPDAALVPNEGVDPEAMLLVEKLPDGPSHFVMRGDGEGFTYFDRESYVIPAGTVFCMGDNRDNSADSRLWKFVPVDTILGRGEFVFWSAAPSPGLMPSFRFSRFFSAYDPL